MSVRLFPVQSILAGEQRSSNHSDLIRKVGEQATFTTDGESIMDSTADFDHFVRSIAQVVLSFVKQYPRHRLARVDMPRLISAFSQVSENTRVVATPWPMSGGWAGTDAQAGTTYAMDILGMDDEALNELYNSDEKTKAPYGNTLLEGHPQRWKSWNEKVSTTIPICVASDTSQMHGLEANPHIRRSTFERFSSLPT